MGQKTLEAVVGEFRNALQELARSGFYFNISITNRFPNGSCDDSSQLLAAYLTDQGFPGALRISGEAGGRDGELCSHAWLMLDGKHIDITGSQFDGYSQPEILIRERDDLLESFEIDSEPRLADFRTCSYLPQYAFNEAYEAVISRMLKY